MRARIEVLSAPGRDGTEREELRAGLEARPRRIPSKHFYDRRGSALFEAITGTGEYYPTRTEGALLAAVAPEVAAASGAEELVELGAGAATKTRLLLDALAARGSLRRFVPVDVNETMVRRVARELASEYPGLEVHGLVGDFLRDLDGLPPGRRRLLAFLGSTIGNLRLGEARAFLRRLARRMAPGDSFLLGADLIKDRARLEAAYNDDDGLTAAFNRNILRVVNRRFDADFDPDAFVHRAIYNDPKHRIEMWLDSSRDQRVRVGALDLDLEIEAGEPILTEVSLKYDRTMIEGLLAAAGLEPNRWWTDEGELFGLSLASPRGRVGERG